MCVILDSLKILAYSNEMAVHMIIGKGKQIIDHYNKHVNTYPRLIISKDRKKKEKYLHGCEKLPQFTGWAVKAFMKHIHHLLK